MEIKRPLLLISNDDGYQAKGINTLVEMLSDMGDILVCAPEEACSGFSCAFSATKPLRLRLRSKREGVEIWSCNGTPVDCVKMALAELAPRKPDRSSAASITATMPLSTSIIVVRWVSRSKGA